MKFVMIFCRPVSCRLDFADARRHCGLVPSSLALPAVRPKQALDEISKHLPRGPPPREDLLQLVRERVLPGLGSLAAPVVEPRRELDRRVRIGRTGDPLGFRGSSVASVAWLGARGRRTGLVGATSSMVPPFPAVCFPPAPTQLFSSRVCVVPGLVPAGAGMPVSVSATFGTRSLGLFPRGSVRDRRDLGLLGKLDLSARRGRLRLRARRRRRCPSGRRDVCARTRWWWVVVCGRWVFVCGRWVFVCGRRGLGCVERRRRSSDKTI
jgi:hypothetical protein